MLREGIGISNAEIIGREDIDAWLFDYPFIARQFGLHKFNEKLLFDETDLIDIVVCFSRQRKKISQNISAYNMNFNIIPNEEKNRLNNLSKEYFEFILEHSNVFFDEIRRFLTKKGNEKYAGMYANTISDLQAKIILERNRFTEFQYLIEHLVDFVVLNNHDKLKDLRSVVRMFIHFMYVNCHIGKKV